MKRREFVTTLAFVGLGLAVVPPDEVIGWTRTGISKMPPNGCMPHYAGPRGGCTEAGIVLFDKGPFGKNCFGLHG